METEPISLVRWLADFRRCIKRFLKKLTFVRPADSQSLRDKYIKTTKIIKSIILSVYFNSIRNSLASFFFRLSFLSFFVCPASTFCAHKYNKRAQRMLFSYFSLEIFFIVFNLFCHLSSVVFSNATNEIQFAEKPFFSGINEIDFK